MKHKLIGIIICTLLIGTVLPVTGTSLIDKTTSFNMSGNTLYVGGSGGENYTRIQDAINDSVDGDTVFVYDDSSPYYESLTINKEITLLGEDKETTIIDALKEFNTIVNISADSVTISGFTIQNCNDTDYSSIGIEIIEGDYISINNNIISTSDKPYDGAYGIKYHYQLFEKKYNTITNNKFINNSEGIHVRQSPFINISNNIFRDNKVGITRNGNNAIIQGNLIDNCKLIGILVSGENNIVTKNTISNQKSTGLIRTFAGIVVSGSNNQIINNNLIDNKRNAICFDTLPWENKCDGNYWDNWIGLKYPQLDFIPYIHRFMFWFVIDWNPAKEPYDI